MEAIKTVTRNGLTARVFHDDLSESPRGLENMGAIVTKKSRHISIQEGNLSFTEAEKAIERDEVLGLPVYAYVHGNIALSTSPFSCPWDSGQVGFITASKEKVREVYGVKRITKQVRELALKGLKCEVALLGDYVNGDVYYVQVFNDKGDVVEDGGGFLGEEALQDALDNMLGK